MYVHALGRFGRALATALCTLFFCTYRIQDDDTFAAILEEFLLRFRHKVENGMGL